MSNYLVYDAEIIKAIPDQKPREDGIEYCGGWHDFAGMGISVIGAWDFAEDRPRIFLRSMFAEFFALAQKRQVVGFNSLTFDDKLMAANAMPVVSSYDIYRELLSACGLDPFPSFYGSEYKGHGLHDVAMANGGIGKTGDGANAAVLWQQKQAGRVIDYCLNDVSETRKLFAKILRGEPLTDPRTGRSVMLRHPDGKKENEP